jgi:glycosyltransferase involved in cell wall biosynthesis
MLRVLQLSAPLALAGAERVMLNFLQNYDAGALSVRVASYLNHQRLDNSFTAELERQGIGCDKIPIGNTSLAWQVRQTVDAIKRHGIDVLHTHGYRSDFVGLISARVAGVPIVSTVHGWTPVSLKLRGYQALDRFCLKRFDAVVCVSTLLHQEFARLGVRADRLVYLPNAVTVPQRIPGAREVARRLLGIAPEEKIIVAVGRLSPEKGLDLLLEAFARQFGSGRGVRLMLVGDGPDLARLKSLAGRLGLQERVVFAGFCSQVADYYAAADLFVMSSHTEGFPMSLLEAMAWGLPALVTAVGGIPDIIDSGSDGFLVPAGDAVPLAGAMGKLLGDPAWAGEMGRLAAQKIAQRFASDQWAAALGKVYARVAKTQVGGRGK